MKLFGVVTLYISVDNHKYFMIVRNVPMRKLRLNLFEEITIFVITLFIFEQYKLIIYRKI